MLGPRDWPHAWPPSPRTRAERPSTPSGPFEAYDSPPPTAKRVSPRFSSPPLRSADLYEYDVRFDRDSPHHPRSRELLLNSISPPHLASPRATVVERPSQYFSTSASTNSPVYDERPSTYLAVHMHLTGQVHASEQEILRAKPHTARLHYAKSRASSSRSEWLLDGGHYLARSSGDSTPR